MSTTIRAIEAQLSPISRNPVVANERMSIIINLFHPARGQVRIDLRRAQALMAQQLVATIIWLVRLAPQLHSMVRRRMAS